MKIITTLFILLFNISYSLAETTDTPEILKEYDIEIIIFEDAHARYLNSESWHKNSSDENHLTDMNAQIKPESNNLPAKSFKSIKPALIKKEYKRINNSSEFNVLQYSAWRQAGLKSADAFEIDISKLKNTHKSQTENAISGQIKVVLARYLHFYSKLEYQRLNDFVDSSETLPDSKDTNTEKNSGDETKNIVLNTVNNSYTLQSHRRMRSKELHYIDHPLVGILIQINPVDSTPVNQAK
jgi:hypothetical protein